MDISPSSENSRGGGDFFNTVDSILAKTRKHSHEPVHPLEWLGQAKKMASRFTGDVLLGGANKLLDEHPHEELLTLLNLPLVERQGELAAIRQHRRLFLVARDGIILSTDKHYSEEYSSLRRVCFTLGRFADSGGASNLFAVTARGSLQTLLEATKLTHEYLHDDEQLQIKYLHALDGMGLQKSFHEHSHQSLHQRRKTFRRAVNALVLLAADTGDEYDLHVAEGGLRINTAMGHISDSLDR